MKTNINNPYSRNFGNTEIEVFISEFGLDIKEWEDDLSEDDAWPEQVELEDVQVEMEVAPESEEKGSEEPRPLSGKHARQQRALR